MEERSHALLSASSSHRWLICTPSAVLEQKFQEEASTYAAEGTAAHELAEYKLKKYMGLRLTKPESQFDSKELEYYTDIYFDLACELISEARSRTKDAVVLIEQKLDFSEYAPGGFGSGDLIIVSDELLDIMDLKYGRGVEVSADHNPQMMLYALGALNLFDSLYDIQNVRMTICQPRLDNISSFEMTVDELNMWAETELKPKAELAAKGEGIFKAGEHCRFCRARFICRARAEYNLELAKFDFKKPGLLTDDEVAEILKMADSLSAWAEDIWNYALEGAVNQGKMWTGYKLVEGRSNRKYTDEVKVAEAVLAAGKVTEKDIYTRNLIGVTLMEKLLGKKQFGELLKDLIEKPQGRPALVPITDKRPEINSTAEADFK